MSQADNIQLNGTHVTQYIGNMQQRDGATMQNFKACRDTIMDAVQLYADEKDQALIDKLRGQFVTLIETERQVQHHKTALGQLYSTYQADLEKTDFQEVLQGHMQQAQAADRFQAEADDDLKVFDEAAGIEQEQQQEEMDDDEDLVITNDRGFKNEKCPYTLVPVAELQNPVEDQMGFIYERAAIENAIKAASRDRCNWVECPLPGVKHAIMLHHLKPVNKRRLQLLAKLRQKQQEREQGTQAANRVVLDA